MALACAALADVDGRAREVGSLDEPADAVRPAYAQDAGDFCCVYQFCGAHFFTSVSGVSSKSGTGSRRSRRVRARRLMAFPPISHELH